MINNYMVLNTEEEIKQMKWSSNVKFKCDGCGVLYEKTKRRYLDNRRIRTTRYTKRIPKNKPDINNKNPKKCKKTFHTYGKTFCTDLCRNLYNKSLTVKEYICKVCNKNFTGYEKNNPKFCGSSCAATYNNSHKTKGYRRSKLELYLEKKLKIEYPKIKIIFNSKKAINSELDIYIPKLKLAFELNGIFHYEPIYGNERLSKIINNDNRKFQACLENNIELCIIDTSKQKYFKESTSIVYLDIIKNIIDKKIVHISDK